MEIRGSLSKIFNTSGSEYGNAYSLTRWRTPSENFDNQQTTDLDEKEQNLKIKNPELKLTAEQRQIKEDLQKIHHLNAIEILAGRMPPINLKFNKLKLQLEKNKKDFHFFLFRNSMMNLHKKISEMRGIIDALKKNLFEIQEYILDIIQSNNDLIEQVDIAINVKDFERLKNGEFSNKSLDKICNSYLCHHTINSDLLKEFSLEQLLAMVEEEREYLISQNIQLSTHLDFVNEVLKESDEIDYKLALVDEISKSDLPEEIKKAQIKDVLDNINLDELEAKIENIENSMNSTFNFGSEVLIELEKSNNNLLQKSLKFDPVLSKF